MVHAVAFALREELDGEFLNTSREGYRIAQDISSYSLTALARETAPLMEGGGSIVTLSYLGGERVVPHYNVMGVAKAALEMSVRYLAADLGPKGIRVNAISAGPIKTLAASGVHGLSKMLEYHRTHAPLRKTTDQDEVGDAALFLVSRLSRGSHRRGHPRGRRLPRDGHGGPLGGPAPASGKAPCRGRFRSSPCPASSWRAPPRAPRAPARLAAPHPRMPRPRRARSRPSPLETSASGPTPTSRWRRGTWEARGGT